MDEKPVGQVAYEAYCAFSGGRSLVSGASLPEWRDLDMQIQLAWMEAGGAARRA